MAACAILREPWRGAPSKRRSLAARSAWTDLAVYPECRSAPIRSLDLCLAGHGGAARRPSGYVYAFQISLSMANCLSDSPTRFSAKCIHHAQAGGHIFRAPGDALWHGVADRFHIGVCGHLHHEGFSTID